jgi:O-acetyl-ADP-ribose deacetylase (regulator of RNase III)
MTIKYVQGDATSPSGDGKKLIIHVCNDIGAWGAGFVLAISKKWPQPETNYKSWRKKSQPGQGDSEFKLGNIQIVKVEDDVYVVNMIGQRGIRTKKGVPPVRYDAIEECLKKVALVAKSINASIHAPKFGAGLAGGDWTIIEKLIEKHLCDENLDVTVYEFEDPKTSFHSGADFDVNDFLFD